MGEKADMNKVHIMRDLSEVEKFMGFLIKFPLLPCVASTGHIGKIVRAACHEHCSRLSLFSHPDKKQKNPSLF